jgi:hypothetical protein
MMLPACCTAGAFLDACKVLEGWSSEDEDGRAAWLAISAAWRTIFDLEHLDRQRKHLADGDGWGDGLRLR